MTGRALQRWRCSDTHAPRRLNAMSLLTIPALIGPICGPPLGGFITTYATWHWRERERGERGHVGKKE